MLSIREEVPLYMTVGRTHRPGGGYITESCRPVDALRYCPFCRTNIRGGRCACRVWAAGTDGVALVVDYLLTRQEIEELWSVSRGTAGRRLQEAGLAPRARGWHWRAQLTKLEGVCLERLPAWIPLNAVEVLQ